MYFFFLVNAVAIFETTYNIDSTYMQDMRIFKNICVCVYIVHIYFFSYTCIYIFNQNIKRS